MRYNRKGYVESGKEIMFSRVLSSAVCGVDGTFISVESDISEGLPAFTLVGYLAASVKEAGERVRTALKNSNFIIPPKRITINLSPADIRKDGSGFDLAIALGLLLSMGNEEEIDLSKTLIVGELSLNGEVCPICGILPMVHHAYKNGITNCIVPYENASEALLIEGMHVVGVKTLREAYEYVIGVREYKENSIGLEDLQSGDDLDTSIDFAEIKGQPIMKRGMEIAAAGGHNILMAGSAGAGKSMLAKRLPSILPDLSFDESIEVTKVYSVMGMLKNKKSLIRNRPFRSPHHSITANALCGGGGIPRPGEISLAHNGVLFLDELPEFSKNTLEAMRQPLEDKKITVSRVNAKFEFPCNTMLVAAMNPCPCGHYPNLKKCTCLPLSIKRYQERISGPLMDRIDILLNVKAVPYEELFDKGCSSKEETSAIVKERVSQARNIQYKRYKDERFTTNSCLEGTKVKQYIYLTSECEDFLKDSFRNMDLSARGMIRILKVARTIADLDGVSEISINHLKEAIFFRNGGVSNV